jgi:hypothetical protein
LFRKGLYRTQKRSRGFVQLWRFISRRCPGPEKGGTARQVRRDHRLPLSDKKVGWYADFKERRSHVLTQPVRRLSCPL